jgi:hypothetical protein
MKDVAEHGATLQLEEELKEKVRAARSVETFLIIKMDI